MKIDIFAHVFPPKYKEALYRWLPASVVSQNRNLKGNAALPALWDMDVRLRIMDEYDDYVQVLTVNMPSPDIIPDPKYAAEAAKVVNDEMAELVTKYPHKFVAGVASLSMSNMEAALEETDRAIKTLGLKGVRLDSNVNGKPLDSPEFMPLYEKIASYDLPIWIHPVRDDTIPDYITERKSKYGICNLFGWTYETAVAMTRLVCSGVLEKYPNLKIITHHCGGLVPFFPHRMRKMWDSAENRGLEEASFMKTLSKRPVEYFRMFYNDTVVGGGVPTLMCGYHFFGADHLLFGTDMPFQDAVQGRQQIGEVIRNIDQMEIPLVDKKKIFEDNAKRLLHLQ
jgi:aminocarboxymuconate-semialdehyde decarboxylase